MNLKLTQLSYRMAAVENASSVGLVVILYDLLIEDLRQALEAIAKRDIEARSAAIKHGLSVLQQLEGSLDKEKGGEAAANLAKFYSVMRCRIFEGHLKVKPEVLSEQIALLLDVRGAWQQVDTPDPAPAAQPESSASWAG